MTFVNPFMLFGLLAIGLPIVLHLLMRRKPKHIEFPALRFIQKRQDTNQRRLRLRHLLLLALRVGAIGLLALAIARPSVKLAGSLGSQEAPVAAALVFDTSMRMQYQQENRSRLEVAQELGLWLLAQLPGESQIGVLDTRLGPGSFQVDRGAAKHRIGRLEPIANSRPITETLEEAIRLVEQSELVYREIYLFTDLARAAWPADATTRLEEQIRELQNLTLYVIDVGVDKPNNTGLDELRLSAETLSSRTPLRIETLLSHRGEPGERTVELILLETDPDSGQPTAQKRSEQTLDFEPDESQPVDFTIGGLGEGTHQGYVEIVGQDGLASDDRRYFTVEVQPPWPILLAAPEEADEYALFLRETLAPASYRRLGQARFDCRVVALGELAELPIDSYAAVCLIDPGPLTAAVWQKLGDFASDGSGVAIFLGRNAKRIETFNRPAAQELLPGPLALQARRPDGDLYLAPRDFQHPILASLAGMAGSIPWDAMPVFRYWQFDALAEGAHVIVRYTDGRPAVIERPLGGGRVLTMTTPVSDDPNAEPWNLLPVGQSWPFLILTNEMISYLVGTGDRRLNYYAGQTAVLRLDSQKVHRSYLLSGSEPSAAVEMRLPPDLRRNVLEVAVTDSAGNYRVQAGGGETRVDLGFSVNLDPKQTDLTRLDGDELDAMLGRFSEAATVFGPFAYRTPKDRDQFVRDVNKGRTGRELFPFLICLVALALGIEHVLANRFYKE